MKKLAITIILSFVYSILFSQSEFTAQLQKAFTTYQQRALPEKIFMHTDKDFYVAGEILWFKLYDVDGLFHKPLNLSKVAYVEIISADSNVVSQAKIELHEGSGHGSFMLPVSLNTGSYVVRSYTSWMKNFAADDVFQKSITIVNTLRRPDWRKTAMAPVYDLRFFPEGGNLVNGIPSKLAFKLTDQYGKGINCKGIIVNQKNDTISSFVTHRFGMGQLLFKPVAGDTYRAVATINNGAQISALVPTAFASGYVMSLHEISGGGIVVSVTNLSPVAEDAPIYLFVHSSQRVNVILQQQINSGNTLFHLTKEQLGEGISQFTVFDRSRQPVCERLFFKIPVARLNISIQPDRNIFASRSKVTLDIRSLTERNELTAANLSLSVFLLDSLQQTGAIDITSYLWLTSELKGVIESPAYYFEDSSEATKFAMENLLLTQGWRRFSWEDVTSGMQQSFPFLPEYEGHIITAKLINKKTGEPAKGIKGFLTIPGKNFRLSSAASDDKGLIYFVMGKAFGQSEMIIQTIDTIYQVDLITPFSIEFTGMLPSAFNLSEKLKDDLRLHSVSAQSANAYFNEERQRFAMPETTYTTAFYGVPDKTYYLDNYTRFTTMEEVMREYVPEVRVRKQNDAFHYQVKNTLHKTYFSNDPLVLLDGVPVSTNSLMAFDPLKIKKLEVVAREYFVNDMTHEGIVSYSTYEGDLGGYELPSNAVIVEFEGLQLKREFYAPIYETDISRASRLPDFRNLLHWCPNIKMNEKGKVSFYTSDLPGRYAVVVQGIDQNGVVGSKVITLDVKK